MVDWHPVTFSIRIVAEAYLPERGSILVRFKNDGVEWEYKNCSLDTWKAFTAPGQSRGQFIYDVLDQKPNGRWRG
ncbi:Uncharacterised protein [Mycobacteroides abscessus subsp. abscessus]|uniref:hypothetical protein n=1 Tax=Mycobacteroides abscessus TaxID=36809 RepID=UPI00092B0B0A|nr:hypothetical protein [Mycobacteroides abscessus]SIF22527.1 Uncharacterised protein [Mycobacteroides abscessus subsp. abscessus]